MLLTTLLLKKGMMQNLIHSLKYKKQEDVGIFLGAGLVEFESHLGFKEIECMVPVPLHHRKLKQRGFNQVTRFGQEIARKLGTEFTENVLEKNRVRAPKHLKNILDDGTIDVTFMIENPEILKNKHILLKDDLVTTRATLKACGNKLLEIKNPKLSITTMANND